ncbi:MAG: hypothetical protein WA708_04335 [Acidobacteriaceae bacterium]
MGLIREFQHSLRIQCSVADFGTGESVDRHSNLVLFDLPLAHLSLPEVSRNLAVQLVDVRCVHAIADYSETGFQPRSFGAQLAFRLFLIFAQCGDNLGRHLKAF